MNATASDTPSVPDEALEDVSGGIQPPGVPSNPLGHPDDIKPNDDNDGSTSWTPPAKPWSVPGKPWTPAGN